MTDIPIPAGPTNKELVDLAYLALGMTDTMFGRTEEEYASGVGLLRAMMGEWPFDQLGYDYTTPRPSERSGIEQKWTQAVSLSLAERIAPAVGKALSPQSASAKARSYSTLCAAVGNKSTVTYPNNTPAGAGQGRSLGFGAFFRDGD
ncbi:hypothetical protein Saro_2998 [Novosphingobium aromaticivorans DSM 12444]|jgi:hypothetical protein|uniref:Uncharacterized protein n=1 Tax=Novosphingobium aromaticivorans (strain ATCC 700278 / DSM 12444 / CCUG 56034 / CIP 105152 / NBRC 16084 / F199) TaxID=279238 RepID=Q2G3Z0_NOVAD|nr:packaged DNA stabilization gp4 family protein [Novosphingobium aromaticivorans]ABD27433.1 hypothetical protein Saro_2998 [Novosphingobium aromaticivorans DSM 12444]SCY69236.1 P22 tail accessory factor [Novosphingobium aromaticivorans]